MTDNYRQRLFDSYNATHVAYLDTDEIAKGEWFLIYAQNNYLDHLKDFDRRSARILEIACNKGYLLAAFHSLGFRKLYGVDLSPDDVKAARARLPDANISCIDGSEYLEANPQRFDVIVLKALLEHLGKNDVIPLLEKLRDSLAPNGIVIVEVPNMDWLLAQHERYMDFTHETGYTRESLAQLIRNVFDEVKVVKASPVIGRGIKTKIAAFFRPALVYILGIGFRILGDGASDTWWDTRSIIAIATSHQKTSP